ncbi:MAG: hypothetical protein PF569_04640 [Candidatus Woesearchaeota archaeon]|jgi:hypothetical protein|nr:hypothetical protein [Candidatus Woesearchaeota archaeon]
MENNKNYDKFKELESDFKKIIMEMDKESKENNKTYRTFKVR